MTTRIGIVMDPIAKISYHKDSTLAMMWAAQERGWQVFYIEMQDLFAEQGQAMAAVKPIVAHKDDKHWYDLGEEMIMPLADLDVIFMRKDPPFDNEYIYATYILEVAEKQGTLIVNKPSSLRDCNEKFFATQFPQLTPPHMVARDKRHLVRFYHEHKDVIFKPLDGMGGSQIFRVKEDDPNLSVILETLTNHGQWQIMAQKYLPEIKQGDKRILVIDGKPVDYCLARIPADGETRGNLAAGGRGVTQPLSDRDREIAETVAPELVKRGLIFVGLDVIGDSLTEINVTSPTCIREITRDSGIDVAALLMEAVASKLTK
ncbi:glutathione synthase [Salinibius halmophilus]|uniref:glutathione synthase n=1 Tax=Salinibius halmophilus TaxID=1853216 RepID=UPI000E65F076|nr:glutathione synthase [Salinibius halmophilus]